MAHELYQLPVEAFYQGTPVPASVEQDTAALSGPGVVLALRARPADWWVDARNAIRDLLTLPSNWDSYGASSVAPDSVGEALGGVEYLSCVAGVTLPTVTATGEGHVGLCWDVGRWSLDASIAPSGLIRYVFLDERDATRNQEGHTRDYSKLAELASSW